MCATGDQNKSLGSQQELGVKTRVPRPRGYRDHDIDTVFFCVSLDIYMMLTKPFRTILGSVLDALLVVGPTHIGSRKIPWSTFHDHQLARDSPRCARSDDVLPYVPNNKTRTPKTDQQGPLRTQRPSARGARLPPFYCFTRREDCRFQLFFP